MLRDIQSKPHRLEHPQAQTRNRKVFQPDPDSDTSSNCTDKHLIRPRADQFCIYQEENGSRVIACVAEYKAPHKLTTGNIVDGLDECDLEDIVVRKDNETAKDATRRLVAAFICQGFSYMVQAGLEYGYICTGEAFIFLRIPDDSRTVYYYLSIPNKDVGLTTGWTRDGNSENKLHLTAVAQLLAFLLQALRCSPRSVKWINSALATLQSWNVVVEEVMDEVSAFEATPSVYQPSPYVNAYIRTSPIILRRREMLAGCRPPSESLMGSESDEEDGDGPDTPSRPPPNRVLLSAPESSSSSSAQQSGNAENTGRREKGQGQIRKRRYCSHMCLAGLVSQGPIDPKCPNAWEHGAGQQQISQSTLLRLLHTQLNLDLDSMENLGVWGSRGAIFRITLASHGYTMLAKCSPVYFARYLQHEAAVYDRLRPIQGIHVPVCLGIIPLSQPYPYQGVVNLSHMLLLSFGGWKIHASINPENQSRLLDNAQQAMQEIHRLGVLHCDASP